jgi:peptide/nickel transport system ATP-binding protein
VTNEATGPLLDVQDLRTWFETSLGTLHAVDGVTFRLERGQTLGVVGESGSGKSVLARSIMNLLPDRALQPTGTVTFEGRQLRTLPPKELLKVWGGQIGMVFQDPMSALTPTKRVGAQIAESLRLHLGMNRAQARARSLELLQHVGIPEPERRLKSYPHEMSGGMRQRVCIAIAIACSPRLLLADEPTTALDVTIQRQILDLLTRLQREEGMAMILVTHDLGVVAGRTDRTAVMYGGKIVESGSTSELFRQPRHPYTAALLSSIPRIDDPPHQRLAVIPGRPSAVIDPKPACRFAPRCRFAQPRCVEEDPPTIWEADHGHACFYPVGTPEGQRALEQNLAQGRTAAGLPLNDPNATEVLA